MSNNKEHIPTSNESNDDSEQKGSGGLLAPIGDPLGKPPSQFHLLLYYGLLLTTTQAKP